MHKPVVVLYTTVNKVMYVINHIMHSVGRDLKELFTTKQVQRLFNGTPACMAEDKGMVQCVWYVYHC